MKTPRDRRDEDIDGFLKPWLPPGLPKDIIDGELTYKTLSAKYREYLSHKRQLEAELRDGVNIHRRNEIGKKIADLDAQIGPTKVLARDAGELSYATAFYRVANELMSREAFRAIDEETREVMKRRVHEIHKAGSGKGKNQDNRYARVKGFA